MLLRISGQMMLAALHNCHKQFMIPPHRSSLYMCEPMLNSLSSYNNTIWSVVIRDDYCCSSEKWNVIITLLFYVPRGTLHRVTICYHTSLYWSCRALESCYGWWFPLEHEYSRKTPSKTDILENHSLVVMEHLYGTVQPGELSQSWNKSQVGQAVSAHVLIQTPPEAT